MFYVPGRSRSLPSRKELCVGWVVVFFFFFLREMSVFGLAITLGENYRSVCCKERIFFIMEVRAAAMPHVCVRARNALRKKS